MNSKYIYAKMIIITITTIIKISMLIEKNKNNNYEYINLLKSFFKIKYNSKSS